ncbi:MAG: hypothetical protein EBZ13_12285 [Planctomycetia bacterium]|nr:hypothetical protein [Planctomycetia bacterium]
MTDHAPHLSKAFCRVIDGMLLKEPSDRYQSMAEIIDELASWKPEGLVHMPRGEEGSANTAAAISGLGTGEVAGNESKSRQADSDWALGDADSLPPDSGVIVQPGREEMPERKPKRLLKIAGIAAGIGVGGGLLLAAIAATGNQGFGGIVPLAGGVIITVVTAAVQIIRTVSKQNG